MFDKTLKGYVEKAYPLALATICGLLLLVFKSQTIAFFKDHSLSLTQLYTAVFGWASVQTGALLGVYGMVFSKSDGFIGKIKGTPTLNEFYSYTKRSLWIGLALTVLSIPVIVKNQEAKDLSLSWYAFVAFWFSLFVDGIASFARVIMIFGLMVNVKDHERIPG